MSCFFFKTEDLTKYQERQNFKKKEIVFKEIEIKNDVFFIKERLLEIYNFQHELFVNISDVKFHYDTLIYNYFISLGSFWFKHLKYYTKEGLKEETIICSEALDQWFEFLKIIGPVEKNLSIKYSQLLIEKKKLQDKIGIVEDFIKENERVYETIDTLSNMKPPNVQLIESSSDDDSFNGGAVGMRV